MVFLYVVRLFASCLPIFVDTFFVRPFSVPKSAFLSVRISSTRLPVYLPTRLSVYLCNHLCNCPSVRLSVCPSVRLSVCPSVRLSVRPSVRLSVCPSVRLSVCPPVRLSVCSMSRSGQPLKFGSLGTVRSSIDCGHRPWR